MGYFLKRMKLEEANLSFGGATSVLNRLAIEEVIRQSAPKAPYNLKVADEQIDQFLREVAKRGAESISENEFEEWYRQQLNQSQLNDEEFPRNRPHQRLQTRLDGISGATRADSGGTGSYLYDCPTVHGDYQ